MAAPVPDSVPLSNDPPFVLPKRRFLPFVLGVLIAGAVAAFFVVRAMRAPKPQRVLVAIDFDGYWWTGSEVSAVVSDRVTTALAGLGFDVVKGGDPEASKILEKAKSTRDAAQSLHAGFLVEVKITPENIKHERAHGMTELRVESDVVLTYAGESPRTVGRVVTFSAAGDEKGARALLVNSISGEVIDAVVAPMVSHPAIAEILSKHATKEAAELAPAATWAERRDEMTKTTARSYEQLRTKRTAGERGTPKPTFLSAPTAHDSIAGVGPKGWLARTNDIQAMYATASASMEYSTLLETLEWRDPDAPGKTVERVWSGYNVFGYPNAVGDHAVFVEDVFGWAKTIEVVDGGKVREVLSDPEHRYVDPKIAPGGGYVATWDRSCSDCPDGLLVVTTDGHAVLQVGNEGGTFDGMTWIDDHRLLFVHRRSSDPDAAVVLTAPTPPEEKKNAPKSPNEEEAPISTSSIWIVDATKSPPLQQSIAIPPDVGLSMPSANAKGTNVVFASDRGKIGTLDVSTLALGTIDIPAWARWPVFSPDGARVVFELVDDSDDGEIAIVPFAGGDTKLTDNDANDRNPTFSADGRFVLYETTDDDPVFSDRALIWIASLPAPPP